jgi:hypothetical protein
MMNDFFMKRIYFLLFFFPLGYIAMRHVLADGKTEKVAEVLRHIL